MLRCLEIISATHHCCHHDYRPVPQWIGPYWQTDPPRPYWATYGTTTTGTNLSDVKLNDEPSKLSDVHFSTIDRTQSRMFLNPAANAVIPDTQFITEKWTC